MLFSSFIKLSPLVVCWIPMNVDWHMTITNLIGQRRILIDRCRLANSIPSVRVTVLELLQWRNTCAITGFIWWLILCAINRLDMIWRLILDIQFDGITATKGFQIEGHWNPHWEKRAPIGIWVSPIGIWKSPFGIWSSPIWIWLSPIGIAKQVSWSTKGFLIGAHCYPHWEKRVPIRKNSLPIRIV